MVITQLLTTTNVAASVRHPGGHKEYDDMLRPTCINLPQGLRRQLDGSATNFGQRKTAEKSTNSKFRE